MENKGLKVCKSCGAVIAKSAKSCPQCGGKIKKPFYLRWWFIAIIAVAVIAAVSSGGSGDKTQNDVPETGNVQQEKQAVSYSTYTVAELVDDLESNALNAQNKYKDQYVEITGKISVIDSNGSYISLIPVNDDFCLTGVTCNLKDDAQRQKVAELTKDSTVTLKGKITSVGEVMGYTLDIDAFAE